MWMWKAENIHHNKVIRVKMAKKQKQKKQSENYFWKLTHCSLCTWLTGSRGFEVLVISSFYCVICISGLLGQLERTLSSSPRHQMPRALFITKGQLPPPLDGCSHILVKWYAINLKKVYKYIYFHPGPLWLGYKLLSCFLQVSVCFNVFLYSKYLLFYLHFKDMLFSGENSWLPYRSYQKSILSSKLFLLIHDKLFPLPRQKLFQLCHMLLPEWSSHITGLLTLQCLYDRYCYNLEKPEISLFNVWLSVRTQSKCRNSAFI